MHPFLPPLALQRTARLAVLCTLVSTLGGCAMWNRLFGSDDAVAEPQPTVVVAPAVPAAVPVATAPAGPSPWDDPKAVPAPVYVPAPVVVQEVPPPSPLPKPAAAEASAPKAMSANVVPGTPGFYINVGLFAVPTNGSNAVGILRGAGLPVFFDTVETKTRGNLTRVRVGPYAKQADAAAAARKIKGLKLDAVVYQQK